MEEVDRLLRQPNLSTPKGMRAMLELLYATGMRVSEIIHLNVADLNVNLGYVVCHDGDRERVLPIGSVSCRALRRYLEQARRFVKIRRNRRCLPTVTVG